MSDWEDKYIEVDGVKTHYIEAGQGETIVLFHGALLWACGEMNYGPIMKPLGTVSYTHLTLPTICSV